MAYTVILGVCMLLCLLMIGRMLLGHPALEEPPVQMPPNIAQQEGGVGIEITEQTLCELIQQAMPFTADGLAVHISADEKVAIVCTVHRQTVQDSGLVPGELRTALLFLPETCKIYAALHVAVEDGVLTLSCTEAKLGDISLPQSIAVKLTEQLSDAVNAYLTAQSCVPRSLQWSDGTVIISA